MPAKLSPSANIAAQMTGSLKMFKNACFHARCARGVKNTPQGIRHKGIGNTHHGVDDGLLPRRSPFLVRLRQFPIAKNHQKYKLLEPSPATSARVQPPR